MTTFPAREHILHREVIALVRPEPQLLLLLPVCALLAWLACRRFDPQRPHGRVLKKCVAGVFLLALWNAAVPLRLGVNPLSALIAGNLGLPGLGLLAVMALTP